MVHQNSFLRPKLLTELCCTAEHVATPHSLAMTFIGQAIAVQIARRDHDRTLDPLHRFEAIPAAFCCHRWLARSCCRHGNAPGDSITPEGE